MASTSRAGASWVNHIRGSTLTSRSPKNVQDSPCELLAKDLEPLPEPIEPDPGTADQMTVAVQVQARQGDPERAGRRVETRRGGLAEMERRKLAFPQVLIANVP